MLPQHLKQIRVLMLNDKENVQRTLFRLEQGKVMYGQTDRLLDQQIFVCLNPDFYMCMDFTIF